MADLDAREFLTQWAHDAGATAVHMLEDQDAALVAFGKGDSRRWLLLSAHGCKCGLDGCRGYTVKHDSVGTGPPE